MMGAVDNNSTSDADDADDAGGAGGADGLIGNGFGAEYHVVMSAVLANMPPDDSEDDASDEDTERGEDDEREEQEENAVQMSILKRRKTGELAAAPAHQPHLNCLPKWLLCRIIVSLFRVPHPASSS